MKATKLMDGDAHDHDDDLSDDDDDDDILLVTIADLPSSLHVT